MCGWKFLLRRRRKCCQQGQKGGGKSRGFAHLNQIGNIPSVNCTLRSIRALHHPYRSNGSLSLLPHSLPSNDVFFSVCPYWDAICNLGVFKTRNDQMAKWKIRAKVISYNHSDKINPTRQIVMSVRANFADIYLQGMRNTSIRSGTELARKIQLTDWSTAGNLSSQSSGVQLLLDICTRFGRYLYSTECSCIIIIEHINKRLHICTALQSLLYILYKHPKSLGFCAKHMFAKYPVKAKTSSQYGFGFDNVNPFHVIAGAQSKRNSCCSMLVRDKQTAFNRFLPMSKQNAAGLFKKTILGAHFTERDWNQNYPENLLFVWSNLLTIFGNRFEQMKISVKQ